MGNVQRRLYVRSITAPAFSGEPCDGRTLILIGRDGIVLAVIGYGTSEGKWRICPPPLPTRSEDERVMAKVLGVEPDADGYFKITDLGAGMVWATETTFAHVVYDILNNA